MNAIKWRALGRTLGLDEDILLNLEHAHKSAGVRECAYQMLLEWKVGLVKSIDQFGFSTTLIVKHPLLSNFILFC